MPTADKWTGRIEPSCIPNDSTGCMSILRTDTVRRESSVAFDGIIGSDNTNYTAMRCK